MTIDRRLYAIFRKRTHNIFRHQLRRARKAQAQLDFDVNELRIWMEGEALGQPCPYCAVVLTARNISVDHNIPTSRGGGYNGANLDCCCERCNQTKGNLTAAEFKDLLALVGDWHPAARNNLLARLRAGGKLIRHHA